MTFVDAVIQLIRLREQPGDDDRTGGAARFKLSAGLAEEPSTFDAQRDGNKVRPSVLRGMRAGSPRHGRSAQDHREAKVCPGVMMKAEAHWDDVSSQTLSNVRVKERDVDVKAARRAGFFRRLWMAQAGESCGRDGYASTVLREHNSVFPYR